MNPRCRLLTVVFLISGAAYPQGPTAALVGTVTDSTGGVIAGANIRVRHVETQVEQSQARTQQAHTVSLACRQAFTS